MKVKRKVFENMMDILSSCEIDVAPMRVQDGIRVASISVDRNRFVDVRIPESSIVDFASYDDVVGIDTEKLRSVLKNLKSSDDVELIFSQSALNVRGNSKSFFIRYMEIEETKQSISEFDPDVVISISAQKIRDAVNAVFVFNGDEIVFSSKETGVVVSSSDDIGNHSEVLMEGEYKRKDDMRCVLRLANMKRISDALQGSVTLYFKSEFPVHITSEFEGSTANIYIAPLVER